MGRTVFDISSSSDSSTDSDSEANTTTRRPKKFAKFRCVQPQKAKSTLSDDLFTVDVSTTEEPAETSAADTEVYQSVDAAPIDLIDDPEVKEIMKRAPIQPGFDQKSHSEVAPKSFRGAKRQRKAEREKTKGNEWYDLPATEMTEERRRDLELLQMRDALDSKTHYRRNDRDVLPKYFQIGKVIETKADYYSSRVVKKQRKRTMVEELLADHEVVAKNKRRYDKIMAREAITKRGAFQRKGFISKRSKRKKGTTAE